jgi:hypothetical protein
VDKELLTLMADAGCRHIYFGVETASTRMQEITRKRLDVRLVEPTLDITSRLDIETTTSFITGYPEESLQDQKQTLDMAGRLFCRADAKNISQLHLLTPEPGTELLARHNRKLRFDGHISDFNFPMLDPDDRDLIVRNRAIFSNHHYFPSTVPRQRHVFVTAASAALWTMGRAITGYMLRGFEGRLSCFMAMAIRWYETTSPKRWNVDARAIQAFIEAQFGRQHHIVSLLRYAQAMERILRAGRASGRQVDATMHDPRDAIWSIGAGTVVLRDIHDCLSLLEKIDTMPDGQLLADAAAGPLEHLLLVAQPPRLDDGENCSVSTYQIDGTTADLLARFENPKTYWECCRDIANEDEQAAFPQWSDLAALCDMGVLDNKAGRSGPVERSIVSRL